MAQKLWEKNVQVNEEIDRFTVGRDREMDLYLAKHDILGSMAHITMLESIGLLTSDELKVLLDELKNIYASAEKGEFVIEDGIEDVHSQVELMLTRRLGDVGKKIHSGRSRNDQVLVDLKLFTRAQLKNLAESVEELFRVLIAQSNRYKDVLMPGYTHLQIAMPSSFGLWFGAYAESLVDDMLFLQAAYRMCNRNPLGSAPSEPGNDNPPAGIRFHELQCCLCPDGTRKNGAQRGICHGFHRRHPLQDGFRRLHVQLSELRICQTPGRMYHRLQHHAA